MFDIQEAIYECTKETAEVAVVVEGTINHEEPQLNIRINQVLRQIESLTLLEREQLFFILN